MKVLGILLLVIVAVFIFAGYLLFRIMVRRSKKQHSRDDTAY